ncbi:MAG TPA: hypothetical protein VF326_08295 [Anaerolineaceae bacterium]
MNLRNNKLVGWIWQYQSAELSLYGYLPRAGNTKVYFILAVRDKISRSGRKQWIIEYPP